MKKNITFTTIRILYMSLFIFIYISCSSNKKESQAFDGDALSMIEQIIEQYINQTYMCPKDVQEIINLAQYRYNNSGEDTFLFSGALKFLNNNIGCLSIEKVERDNMDDTLICLIMTSPIKDTLSTTYFSKDYLVNHWESHRGREYKYSFADKDGRMLWSEDLASKVYTDIKIIEKKHLDSLKSLLKFIDNWESFFYIKKRVVVLEWKEHSLKNLRKDFTFPDIDYYFGGAEIDYEKQLFYSEIYRYFEKIAEENNLCRITALMYTYDLVSD